MHLCRRGRERAGSFAGEHLAVSGDPVPITTTSQFPAAKVSALQATLAGVVSNYAHSHLTGARGITAAVLSDQGSWAGAAGAAGDGTKLAPDAMMAVDSITKTFVAAEVMRLAAADKVSLKAPMSTYLTQPLTANGATVAQMLSMRSGLVDPPGAVVQAMVSAQAAAPATHWTALQTLAYLKPHSSAPGGCPSTPTPTTCCSACSSRSSRECRWHRWSGRTCSRRQG